MKQKKSSNPTAIYLLLVAILVAVAAPIMLLWVDWRWSVTMLGGSVAFVLAATFVEWRHQNRREPTL